MDRGQSSWPGHMKKMVKKDGRSIHTIICCSCVCLCGFVREGAAVTLCPLIQLCYFKREMNVMFRFPLSTRLPSYESPSDKCLPLYTLERFAVV